MWIGERGELHVVFTPLWRALGPELRHRLAGLTLPRLRALERRLRADGLDALTLFHEVAEADRTGTDLGDEAAFVGVPLPDDVRLEIAPEVPADGLAEALVSAVRDVPLRWRPDVVLGLEDLLLDLEDRRPTAEHRATVWRRYGSRHGGRRHHGRR